MFHRSEPGRAALLAARPALAQVADSGSSVELETVEVRGAPRARAG